MKVSGVDRSHKLLEVAITHGETQESFLHYFSQYLQHAGLLTAEISEELDREIGVNQGINTHIGVNSNLIVMVNDSLPIEVPLQYFQRFLQGLRSEKQKS